MVYKVEVYTGSEPNSGTDADVYLQIFGTRGDAGKRQLYWSTSNFAVKFHLGQVDIFEVEAVSLGDITKIIIGHESRKRGVGSLFCF